MEAKEKKYTWRRLFNDLHLWLGIGSGLILFVVCLTGTIYTFRAEVEELLEPEKYQVTAVAGAARLSPEAVLQRLEQQVGGKVVSIEVPHKSQKAYRLTIKKSEEERRGTVHLVDPYTGKLLGTAAGPATEFFMVIFRLHRWLLLDSEVGRPIVGGATIIFVLLIFSGLVLWFPKKLKHWKQGFTIKADANWKRVNHDLHNTLGFYSFLLLLLMALTGLCWSFEWYKSGLGTVIGTEVFGGRGEKPAAVKAEGAGVVPLPFTGLMAAADKALPYDGDYRITPSDTGTVVMLTKYKTGFFAGATADKIQLNRFNGDILAVDRFSDKPLNQQIASSIKPLHTGEIFGTFSKILYFLACLIGTSLPVTGTIIWINKLRKKAGRQKKPRVMAAN